MSKAEKKLILLALGVFAFLFFVVTPLTSRYTKDCTIWNRDGWDVIVEDENGHLWQFEDRENYYKYEKGTKVKVTFYDNGVDCDILNDEIVKVVVVE